jgi:hypothetical protein
MDFFRCSDCQILSVPAAGMICIGCAMGTVYELPDDELDGCTCDCCIDDLLLDLGWPSGPWTNH